MTEAGDLFPGPEPQPPAHPPAVIRPDARPIPVIRPHADKDEMDRLFPAVREYQALATRHGIRDIFQDNGGKLLQLMLITGFRAMGSREGNDAVDAEGHEFELKTVNVDLTGSFSTHHHLNPAILQKYRAVDWFFAVYRGIELDEVYHTTPHQLEPYFTRWEEKWHGDGGKDINNPKIPVAFVRRVGTMVYRNIEPGHPGEGVIVQA